MARVVARFQCKGIEYVILRKNGRPLIVESDHVDEALMHGAESYPVVCNPELQCWLEVPEDAYSLIQEEMDWCFEW